MLWTHEGKDDFLEKKIRFVATLDLIKCFKADQQRLLLTYTPISDILSNISIMDKMMKQIKLI